jgi:RimJ/RimL family protein N-acetyltransferase
MRFTVERGPRGNWRVMLEGAAAPLSEHDTEEDAQAALASYARGAAAAAAPTLETGLSRGRRVQVRDGEIIVRPVTADDKALLLEGFAELGELSRYRRFMSTKGQLSVAELAYFTEVDHVCHEAVGAIDPGTGAGVGIARFVRDAPDAPAAEAAVVIADRWQGRGVGGVLLRALADRALEVGVTEFEAALLADNKAMLTLFERLGPVEIRREGMTLLIRVPLTA